MRVGSLYENNSNKLISFEFFPPRDEMAAEGFYKVVDKLSQLNPDYMSMTFGAGGSTRDGSYQAVKGLIQDKKIPTVAYIAGFGLGPDDVVQVLDAYKELGVETIFVIRGDKPRDKDFAPHPDSFSYASDLIKFISGKYDFDLGCACYPEGHSEAESLEKDIEFLKLKQDNGAKYAVAQYFYDNKFFYDFLDKCRAAGVTIPVIPGIMPVYTVKMSRMLARVCGTTLPEEMTSGLDRLEGADKQDVLDFGVDYSARQCADLLKNGVDKLHFYTMDRSYSTTAIIERLRQDNLL